MLKTNDMKPATTALAESGIPITATTLRRYLLAGRIPARRVGSRWFTSAEAILKALVTEVRP